MAVEKMKLLTVSGKLDRLDELIDRCCLDGRIQVEQAGEHISGSLGYMPLSEADPYADRLSAVREVAHDLGQELHYRDTVRGSRDDAQVDNDLLSALSKQVKDLQDRKNALNAEIRQAEDALRDLSHFVGMDLPLKELYDSRFVRFRFGRMPRENAQKLALLKDDPYLLFFPCQTEGEDVWGVYFVPVNKVDEVDRLFASLYFQRLRLPQTYETPERAAEDCREKIRQGGEERQRLDDELRRLWDEKGDTCDEMYSRLLYRSAVHEVRSRVVVRRDSFVLIGWVPVREEKAVRAALADLPVQAELTNPSGKRGDAPPTKLKNGALVRPYEEFVEMYGIPDYHDIDPTLFLSVIYTLLFGIMFADLGQGLCVAALGLFLWLKSRSRMGGILLRCVQGIDCILGFLILGLSCIDGFLILLYGLGVVFDFTPGSDEVFRVAHVLGAQLLHILAHGAPRKILNSTIGQLKLFVRHAKGGKQLIISSRHPSIGFFDLGLCGSKFGLVFRAFDQHIVVLLI